MKNIPTINPLIFLNPSVTRTAPYNGKAKSRGLEWKGNTIGYVVNPKLAGKPLTRTDSYLCTVQNDEQGEQFLTELRKSFPLESDFKVSVYGRNPNRKAVLKGLPSKERWTGSSVPKKYATYRDVYVSEKYEHQKKADRAYAKKKGAVNEILNSNLSPNTKDRLLALLVNE